MLTLGAIHKSAAHSEYTYRYVKYQNIRIFKLFEMGEFIS